MNCRRVYPGGAPVRGARSFASDMGKDPEALLPLVPLPPPFSLFLSAFYMVATRTEQPLVECRLSHSRDGCLEALRCRTRETNLSASPGSRYRPFLLQVNRITAAFSLFFKFLTSCLCCSKCRLPSQKVVCCELVKIGEIQHISPPVLFGYANVESF